MGQYGYICKHEIILTEDEVMVLRVRHLFLRLLKVKPEVATFMSQRDGKD